MAQFFAVYQSFTTRDDIVAKGVKHLDKKWFKSHFSHIKEQEELFSDYPVKDGEDVMKSCLDLEIDG